MDYVSTRGSAPALDFADATLAGLASDGGLYVPREWPRFSEAEIAAFNEVAAECRKARWKTADFKVAE